MGLTHAQFHTNLIKLLMRFVDVFFAKTILDLIKVPCILQLFDVIFAVFFEEYCEEYRSRTNTGASRGVRS